MSTARSTPVSPERRFRGDNPCPICGGTDDDRRGQGKRCHGYLSNDGWAHCTREEFAGRTAFNPLSGTYPHVLAGRCPCGEEHAPADPMPRVARMKPKGNGKAKSESAGFDTPGDAARWLARKEGATITGSWAYDDPARTHYASVYRLKAADGKKTYRPVSLDPSTGKWKIKDPAKWWPYRFPEIKGADRVYLFEGEKIVEMAVAIGIDATTTPHGAKSPQMTDLSILAGGEVVVVPDNDPDGEAYAAKIVGQLAKLDPPARVKILRLDLAEEGDDLEQWLEARDGRSPEGLRAEIETLAGSVGFVAPSHPISSENGHAEGGFVGSVAPPPPISPEFEGGPGPLTTDLLPVPPLPPGLIPAPLRGWISDIARRGCFPIEYPTATALVTTSILIGRTLAIRPRRRDSWTVVPNLWGGIVGPPGIQKTPAVEEAKRPIGRLKAEAIEAHGRASLRALEDVAIAEARASAAKRKLAEAAKKGAPDDVLRQLVAEANPPGEVAGPTEKRYETNDSTIEKIGELLRENPRGLLYFRDELTGFFRAMDRQGHESDRAFYLESWPGTGSFTCDRIGRGTVHVPHVCLSIFGTIQPGPLARYLKGAASGEDADGFIPRFQVLMYPDPPAEFINVDEWPDAAAKNAAFDIFRWLDNLNPAAMPGADWDEDHGLHYLRFDDAAQELFDEWRIALERRLRGGSESALLTNHLAKYRSLMPSLALIFHLVDSAGAEHLSPVSYEAAERAAAWCELLEAHARRVYQSAIEGDPEVAARLAERIKASLPNPFTFRQVAVKHWSGLDSVDDVRKAVDILEDRNWVRVVVQPPGPEGGRPSEKVWINPAVYSGKGEGPTP